MQFLSDLLGKEIRVAAAREATAIGIAQLAAHIVLGLPLEELAARWRAEAVYVPRMPEDERRAYLERWERAIAAVKIFHSKS
jgi:glycerol kinase